MENFKNAITLSIKKNPLINSVTIRIKKVLDALFVNKADSISVLPYSHRSIHRSLNSEEKMLLQVQNLLNYTKNSGVSYSATKYPAGYHTIKLFGKTLIGQRDPYKRLINIDFDFNGKTVLDIGTNQGGMVFSVSDRIKWGVGIDYDSRMINTANKIKSCKKLNNLDFFVFDVENEPHELILDFMPDIEIDIIFLLSVCMWIKNWRDLVEFCSENSKTLLFESNGSNNQQLEQEKALQLNYDHVILVAKNSDDDPVQKNRKLFFCKKK
jgi:SAM-dependent methyltransferase